MKPLHTQPSLQQHSSSGHALMEDDLNIRRRRGSTKLASGDWERLQTKVDWSAVLTISDAHRCNVGGCATSSGGSVGRTATGRSPSPASARARTPPRIDTVVAQQYKKEYAARTPKTKFLENVRFT